MKNLFLTLSVIGLVFFTSCKENATKKINTENVTKAAERDAQAIVFPSISFDKTEHDFGQIMNGTPVLGASIVPNSCFVLLMMV